MARIDPASFSGNLNPRGQRVSYQPRHSLLAVRTAITYTHLAQEAAPSASALVHPTEAGKSVANPAQSRACLIRPAWSPRVENNDSHLVHLISVHYGRASILAHPITPTGDTRVRTLSEACRGLSVRWTEARTDTRAGGDTVSRLSIYCRRETFLQSGLKLGPLDTQLTNVFSARDGFADAARTAGIQPAARLGADVLLDDAERFAEHLYSAGDGQAVDERVQRAHGSEQG